MGLWDKLQDELNRAGQVAQGAIDEGRLRIEIFRVRLLGDKAAQALGYAVFRAREKGEALEPAAWDRMAATLREHEAEAGRLGAELARVKTETPAESAASPPDSAPPAEPPPTAPPADQGTPSS
jgi:hypothetical protein